MVTKFKFLTLVLSNSAFQGFACCLLTQDPHLLPSLSSGDFLGDSVVKNLPANAGDVGSISGSGRSLKEKMEPTPVFLSGKSYGQRSLMGYSPWGHKKSDTI